MNKNKISKPDARKRKCRCKNKIQPDDEKHLERGLKSLCGDLIDPKVMKRAKSLYFRYLVDGSARKEAVSCALWEIADKHVQNWAAALQAAYPKRGRKKTRV
jgi:hypothetical protein